MRQKAKCVTFNTTMCPNKLVNSVLAQSVWVFVQNWLRGTYKLTGAAVWSTGKGAPEYHLLQHVRG